MNKMDLPEKTPDEAEALLGTKNVFCFDCNPSRSYNKHHLPGAMLLDPGAFTATDLPADKTSTLLFYCSDVYCGAAPSAARKARAMGYENVFVMRAGIRGWMEAGKKTEP